MRNLRWNSIRTKLIVFLLIPTVICIAAAIMINYSYTTDSLRTRMVEENKNLLYQGYRNIDSYLKEVNRVSLTAYSDSEFYRLLNAGYDDMSANIQIYASLNYIYNSMPGIYQVYLYGMKNHEATLITDNTPKRWQSEVPYFGAIVGGKEQLALESTHKSHHYGITSPILQATEDKVFSLHRRIDKIPLNQALGYLSIDVRASALNDIMSQLYDRDHEKYISSTLKVISFTRVNRSLSERRSMTTGIISRPPFCSRIKALLSGMIPFLFTSEFKASELTGPL